MTATDTSRAIEAVFRIEQAKLIAGLTRMVRDIGLAEELARFRSDRAHAARFSSIADELERLDRAG